MKFCTLFRALFFLAMALFVGCQSAPTKVVVLDKDQATRAFENVQFGKSWDLEKSIIIDTRSRFNYEMSKTPRSFHIFWKDWSLKGYRGVQLEKRKVELQRRLARKGVDPFSRVVIFGSGLRGRGEEMYVAATLFQLGIHKIAIVRPEKFNKSLLAKDTASLASLPYWEEPLGQPWNCLKNGKVKLVSAKDFSKDFKLKNSKSHSGALKSKKSFWAYGAAFQLRKQGKEACVVE